MPDMFKHERGLLEGLLSLRRRGNTTMVARATAALGGILITMHAPEAQRVREETGVETISMHDPFRLRGLADRPVLMDISAVTELISTILAEAESQVASAKRETRLVQADNRALLEKERRMSRSLRRALSWARNPAMGVMSSIDRIASFGRQSEEPSP